MYKNIDLTGAVIEIEEVEYFIDENAAALFGKNAEDIALTRLVDQAVVVFSRKEIIRALEEKGIIDRLT